ncbi:MAG TPA: SOUL heme-binding protein [Dehalococcoidia bacterium]|jgi:hypothetical protein|nr:SOUL heme-binding protein [Dehalococcoidia bacterium]|tara:strand:- start:183 stop:749 length:567 start_codon:yes stop_codon:yes gene_type:complete
MKKILVLIAAVVIIGLIFVAMLSYEEPEYKTGYESGSYSVRFYDERIVVQAVVGNGDSGFGKLFKYISGANKESVKIDMTTPVTQSQNDGEMVMQFYLPSKFDKSNVPVPTDNNVKISLIDAGYFAVSRYSGRSTDKNFYKHLDMLKSELDKDKVSILGPSIKATYNGPFTPPQLRRNEAMYPIEWND